MLWRNLWADTKWMDRGGRPALQIGLTTFGILALELALIRWTSGQVRAFAYINNIVLITAFLGLGLGVALGKRRPGLVHLVLPALLLLALPVAAAEELGLVRLTFPDQSITLWGAETVQAAPAVFARNLAIFLVLLGGVGAVFTCAGGALGALFGRLPVLRAYTADLAGSLAGIAAFTVVAWTGAGPAWWLALGAAPFAWLSGRWWAVVAAAGTVALGAFSVKAATFSPYNRITVAGSPLVMALEVNRDFHQYLHDLSDRRLADPALAAGDRAWLRSVRDLYDLPFTINRQRGSALVVGAGTGNDVQAARRNGYARVTSVDIDGEILAAGRRLHPEQPYADPRVTVVNDDARAYFERAADGTFDVVCFGLLDSHAMASAMSTLRLDNFVYTEQGIRAAWRHVAPAGHLSLAMACNPGPWFFERLYWTIARATGREPLAVYNEMHGGTVTFIVPGPAAQLDAGELGRRRLIAPGRTSPGLTLDDDWPFLYLRPGVFPWGYVAVLGVVLLAAAAVARGVFGLGRAGVAFDGPLFLMGAAFLLIEARGVTSMSLLFGSTWLVNAAIFGGILAMVLAANLAVERWGLRATTPWYLALFAATALLYLFPIGWLEGAPLAVRGLAAGLITGLPIGCAGMIVPALLARSPQPTAALGANLLGAVLGGCLEYFSMLGGLRSTALLALVLYLLAFLLARRAAPAPAAA